MGKRLALLAIRLFVSVNLLYAAIVMIAVECSSKSGPYRRQVCAGTLASEPLTATNTSVGLRTTCTIQFTAAQAITSRTIPTIIWTANGVTRMARNARPLGARPSGARDGLGCASAGARAAQSSRGA
jgi:hypothetical protein